MASLGRRPGAAPLTGADIPDGSVSAVKVAADVATQAELDAKEEFASGTKMIFNQTAAPTGWTKVTGSGYDTELRVTTGTVGTGGSVAFETAFASVTPTITMSNGAITLSESQIPSHQHASLGHSGSSPSGSNANIIIHIGTATNNQNGVGGFTGGGSAHTHTNTASSSAINLDVSYVDVIIATKD